MSKRSMPSSSSKPVLSTKIRKRDEADDLWDDDLDEDVIEDCFRRATQVTPENDVTLLSAYSIFKEPSRMVTSTQVIQSGGSPQEQIKTLQEKYAEKEGEVSILRSHLQNLREASHADEEKKHRDWKEKLSLVEKENKEFKSELEFKNLEVMNLKQQIAELSKLVNNETHSSQKTIKAGSPVKKQVEDIVNISHKIFINVPKYYPLVQVNFLHFGHVYGCDNQKELLKFLENDLPFLISCTDVELKSGKAETSINQALKVGVELLNDFQTILKQVDEKQKHLNSSKLYEINLQCNEIVDLFQQMLPFSDNLRNHLVQRNMALLSNIVCLIGKIQIEQICTKFLSSVITLLCKLTSNDDHPHEYFQGILNHIVSLNPTCDIMNEIISLLATFSIHHFLLSDKESCKLKTFSTLLEKTLPKVKNEDLFISITSNLLNTEYNFFRSKKFLGHQRKCICLQQLYRLTISSIYHCLESHREKFCKKTELLNKSAKILCLIHSNCYESFQKHLLVYAQLKEIALILVQLDSDNTTIKSLEKLCLSEEVL